MCDQDMFPHLRPGKSYLILEQGETILAKGSLCLALHGIGTEEAEAFLLLIEEDGLLCQLAGNPFLCQYMLGFLIMATGQHPDHCTHPTICNCEG